MTTDSQIVYVGHGTVLIDLDGARLLTDPALGPTIGALRRYARPMDPTVWQHIDAVLISHLHHDHLHAASLRQLPRQMRLIAPRGAAGILRRWGFHTVTELAPDDETTVGSITVRATPANHPGGRPPFGPCTSCLGYVVRGSRTIYFAGDTDLFPEMAMLAPRLDLALLPVRGISIRCASRLRSPCSARGPQFRSTGVRSYLKVWVAGNPSCCRAHRFVLPSTPRNTHPPSQCMLSSPETAMDSPRAASLRR